MARCECGALYVPSGKDVKITFRQDSLESHMYLEHETDALVLDENRLVSYGNTTSQSITPNFVSISFDGPEDLAASGLMKVIVRKGSTKIIEKYFGSKNEQWILPTVNNLSTITASCSDILNDVDIANSKIYVEIVSVCDDSPGDCCGNNVVISFRNVIHTVCTTPTTTPAPDIVWRYTPDGDNCIQDVNGPFLSYQECYDSLSNPDPDDPVVPTTSTTTTMDPDAPTTTTTTTLDPNATTTTEDPNATTTTTEEATTTTTTTTVEPTTTTTTTTLPPSGPQAGEDCLIVSGSSGSATPVNGTYINFGNTYNGKKRYNRDRSTSTSPEAQALSSEIYYDGNLWILRGGNPDDDLGPAIIFASGVPNASIHAPQSGWSLNPEYVNTLNIIYITCD